MNSIQITEGTKISYTIGQGPEPIHLEISNEMREAFLKNEEAAMQDLQYALGCSREFAEQVLRSLKARYTHQLNERVFGVDASKNLVDRKQITAKLLSAPAKRMRGANYKTYKKSRKKK
jgi:hypothetical protein